MEFGQCIFSVRFNMHYRRQEIIDDLINCNATYEEKAAWVCGSDLKLALQMVKDNQLGMINNGIKLEKSFNRGVITIGQPATERFWVILPPAKFTN